ncbi:DUF4433 domain-containing protein [Mycobacterium sp. MBM]|nr:DUF4433 domain-containing protein [Mycobacterium sp. MBM]
MAWHFTKLEFLPLLVESGALLCDRIAKPPQVIANQGIKEDRLGVPVDLPGHPFGTVGDHVPFYFSPRSPTSYWMLRHTCTGNDMVFLGVHVGAVATSAACCATDGSAAMPMLTKFTNDIPTIGEFVDLNVLTLRFWNDRTGEDNDRRRRRHAEFLVHTSVPLQLVSHVACYSDESLKVAQELLQDVGGTRHYGVDQNMFMT